jgi:outer membrane protein insertion porin family
MRGSCTQEGSCQPGCKNHVREGAKRADFVPSLEYNSVMRQISVPPGKLVPAIPSAAPLRSCLRPLVAALACALPGWALALEPFVVRDIRVEGLQRTEAGTVFQYLPIKVGDTLTDAKAAAAIKALFATGFFKDVRVEAERDVMIVAVEERPAIAAIEVSGTKEIEVDAVKKAMRSTGLAEGRIFDRALVERAEQELKRLYLARGRYAVQITTTITPLERNRVSVALAVSEGDVAKIKQISIVGAKVFSEKQLLALFGLTTGNWISWYTKNDQYSKPKLTADLEALKSYYLDRGYLEFNVESTQVSITPDKQDIYVTINVSEGKQYTVNEVKLAGDLILPEADLMKLVTLKQGEVFSGAKLNASTKKISDRLGVDGYAFANVNAQPEADKEKGEVNFTIFVDPGRRVYVRRVNIGGNTRTRDEVIRREMRQMEGGYYDIEKVTDSRKRLDRLDYFREVSIDTPPVPGTPDQVDVNVNIVEKPTGALQLGAGFSSTDKFIVSASVTQSNFMGSGYNLGVQVNSSKVNRTYSFSVTNPYLTVDGVSGGFDAYLRTFDPSSTNTGSYRLRTIGSGGRIGYPLTPIDTLTFGLTAERSHLTLGTTPPQRYLNFVNSFGATTTSVLGSLTWTRDTRDSSISPSTGGLQSAGVENSVLGNLKYYRFLYNHARYFPVFQDHVIAMKADFGYGRGLGGKPLPFYKNFYAGGIGSVRGFRASSLGPTDAVTGEYVGGQTKLAGSMEYLMPFPGFGRDKSLRWGGFFDAGYVWPAGSFSVRDMRYSTGILFDWVSPFGPLRFSYGVPLNKKAGDRSQGFQFQLGTIF